MHKLLSRQFDIASLTTCLLRTSGAPRAYADLECRRDGIGAMPEPYHAMGKSIVRLFMCLLGGLRR